MADFHERFAGPCRSSERRCGFFFFAHGRFGPLASLTQTPAPELSFHALISIHAVDVPIRAQKSKSKFDPEAFLAKADGGVTISKYGKGQVVFTQGDPADSVFKIAVLSAQGKEAVVALLKAGDFIGEGCLTGRSQRVSTARAVEDSEITRVDKRTMVRMLREEPNFSERFTAHLWGIGPTGFAQIAVAAA
jgi:CRP-like cAMP-binding protein